VEGKLPEINKWKLHVHLCPLTAFDGRSDIVCFNARSGMRYAIKSEIYLVAYPTPPFVAFQVGQKYGASHYTLNLIINSTYGEYDRNHNKVRDNLTFSP